MHEALAIQGIQGRSRGPLPLYGHTMPIRGLFLGTCESSRRSRITDTLTAKGSRQKSCQKYNSAPLRSAGRTIVPVALFETLRPWAGPRPRPAPSSLHLGSSWIQLLCQQDGKRHKGPLWAHCELRVVFTCRIRVAITDSAEPRFLL